MNEANHQEPVKSYYVHGVGVIPPELLADQQQTDIDRVAALEVSKGVFKDKHMDWAIRVDRAVTYLRTLRTKHSDKAIDWVQHPPDPRPDVLH